ncbi:prepilin-type N-terminal cleavage/methylation domain-containing protein [Massilia sp. SYSU DXS3249]
MMARTCSFSRSARGFTLVEAVIVIVIIGVIGAIVAVFIRSPMLSYTDTVARAEASDEADLALRRMARDIRLALPNSVRVSASGDAIEFLLTTTGGRYLDVDDAATGGTPLDFVGTGTTFSVVGGLRADVLPNQFVVVYNLGPGMAPADAYAIDGADRNIARVAQGAQAGATEITLADNPFGGRNEPMPSPGRRFQVVDGPVMVRCEPEGDGFVLRRYAGYPISLEMPGRPTSGSSAVLARRVAACTDVFRYDVADAELRRSALVLLSLALHTRNSGDAAERAVRLVHQVHVDNTP